MLTRIILDAFLLARRGGGEVYPGPEVVVSLGESRKLIATLTTNDNSQRSNRHAERTILDLSRLMIVQQLAGW